jgi:hypothetical protein
MCLNAAFLSIGSIENSRAMSVIALMNGARVHRMGSSEIRLCRAIDVFSDAKHGHLEALGRELRSAICVMSLGD